MVTGEGARPGTSQPKTVEWMAPEQIAKLAQTQKYLAEGKSPDAVGDMVRDAIRDDRLYVHTDRLALERIKARFAALIEAMPHE